MFLLRAFGWLFLVVALAFAVNDGLVWASEGDLRPIARGELWARVDVASLNLLQALTQRYLHPALWSALVRPVLLTPALPVALLVGLVCLWFGRRRGGERESGDFIVSRGPRRKRGRGALS
ncbi:MAG: hypothetical protein FJX02_05405 [Alphaproteobacteria bacterium]|nr:hypothetical protein [Alphaproteobacteria bacterium]